MERCQFLWLLVNKSMRIPDEATLTFVAKLAKLFHGVDLPSPRRVGMFRYICGVQANDFRGAVMRPATETFERQ